MGRRLKQTFLQRRNTDDQQAHEKMINIANYQRNANQNYEVSPPTSQNGQNQKSLQTINAGEDVEKREPFLVAKTVKNLPAMWETGA